MASEADVRRGLSRDVEYWNVADATAIAKGTLMVVKESSDRTAIAHAGTRDCPIGFAIAEKEANDGATTMGIQVSGLVEAVCTAATATGDLLKPSATANQVTPAVASNSGTISGEFLRQVFAIAMDNIGAAGTGTIKIIRR